MRFSHSTERPTDRKRGRAGVAQRLRRLTAEPLCRDCKAKGRITVATVPDHILPIALGGKDTDDNVRCLCGSCHKLRTKEQFGYRNSGCDVQGRPLDSAHPWNGGNGQWSAELIERRMPSDLKPSRIPLTIVCGPPGSGKSTYIRQHSEPTDLVIDLDAIMQRMSGQPEHHTTTAYLKAAMEERNRQLRSLATDTQHTAAWFIVSAPDPAERATWSKRLAGDLVVIDAPLDECIRRIEADPARKGHTERMIKAATEWWRANA